jgi:hypothetical protein
MKKQSVHKDATKEKHHSNVQKNLNENKDALFQMSHAPKIGEEYHLFQWLPILLFSAVVILITRMATYERPMDQFYWTNSGNDLTDFFSYGKMVAIVSITALALLVILYRFFSQSFVLKRTGIYIPMLIYVLFVGFSYLLSDYKEFSLWGWNDRFEGTVVLIAYMFMLFYVINTIQSEKSVKVTLAAVGISSSVLGLLGISQALDKDFFRTAFGQKLITPNSMLESGITMHDHIDMMKEQGKLALEFTFQNKEIYQTVYNINYVSFYLTLLIPVFGLLFIRSIMKKKEEPLWKKLIYGLLFGLLIYNLIGSASSGGIFGMAIVVLLAIILFNKRIISWWKPLLVLVLITVLVGGITYDRWLPEIQNTFKMVSPETQVADSETADVPAGHLDYIKTEGNTITLGYNGETLIFTTFPEDPTSLMITDEEDNVLPIKETNVSPIYFVDQEPFTSITVRPAQDDGGNSYLVIGTDGDEWPFRIQETGVQYLTGLGQLVSLEPVPAYGFETNQGFGSGRGYIWSRTLPMMKETLLTGHGADTYCAYFPHHDYVGKYNSGTFSTVKDIIVDKPHNMYMGMWIGTGMISVLAFLGIMALYFIQSIRIYWKGELSSFLDFAGAGILLGVVGFLFAGLVNDSSVSVMPLFYTLLGLGISINLMLQKDLSSKRSNQKAIEN